MMATFYFNAIFTVMLVAAIATPVRCYASLAAHATKGAAVNSIFSKGFRTSMMRSQARFGKGAYLAKDLKTAFKEKPGTNAAVLFQKSKSFSRKIIDTRRMSTQAMKERFKVADMRGMVKKNVIGQKLSHRIGAEAGREKSIVAYRSARDPKGTNFFIPRKLYSEHPRIVKAVRTVPR